MTLTDSQIVAIVCFLVIVCGGGLIGAVRWAVSGLLAQYDLRLAEYKLALTISQESSRKCEERSTDQQAQIATQQAQIAAQQRQIDALVDGDIQTARQHRPTEVLLRIPRDLQEEPAAPAPVSPALIRRPTAMTHFLTLLLIGTPSAKAVAQSAVGLLLLAFLGSLLSCGSNPPERPQVPAAIEAETLDAAALEDDLAAVAEESAATQATAQAANPLLLPDVASQFRTAAQTHQTEAARRRALADERRKLRDEATARAKTQQADVDARAARAAQEADDRQARWLAGWAVAGSVLIGAVVLYLTKSPALAAAVPGVVIAAAAGLSAWQIAAPWIAWMLALALLAVVALVVGGLAYVLVTVIREWKRSAILPPVHDPVVANALTAASRARQAPWVRWLLDRILPAHPMSTNTPEVPHV